MSHTAFVYHDLYDLQFGDHVFPTVKYKLVRQALIDKGVLDPAEIFTPDPATDDDVALVHTSEWIRKLKFGTISYTDILRLEIPYSQQVIRAFWLAAGGTILASRLALQRGLGFNIGGGFHHAFPDHGEGFCAIHDVAIAVRRLQRDGLAPKAMIIDTDVHHGNGTAAIFADDPSVFTLSIHQRDNYPEIKPPSSIDIHLEDNIGDSEYIRRLSETINIAIPGFRPDIIHYVAGADPYCQDQLGGLNLTFDGLRERDRIVFERAARENIPVVVTLAGGYAIELDDTVRIHAATAEVGELTYKEIGTWVKTSLT
ncbi:MAG: histone deacetylase [Bryobacterales bacterium]|nr:histone deacetylase [Bryobacterales bacterium]